MSNELQLIPILNLQPKPKYLVYFALLRVVFIPLFLLCRYYPRDIERIMPVYIHNDWAYWIIAMAMSFSSGYLR